MVNYSQQFAWPMSNSFSFDPIKRIEPILTTINSVFAEELIIKDRKKAIIEVKSAKAHLKLLYDDFKLEKDATGAMVVWKSYIFQ